MRRVVSENFVYTHHERPRWWEQQKILDECGLFFWAVFIRISCFFITCLHVQSLLEWWQLSTWLMESILYSILSFFNSDTSVNMSFDAEAMEEFLVNHWILVLDVRVQNIGISGFWNSGLRFCFDIVADEFKTVLSHWEVTSHCVVPAFRLITMFEERFTIMATKLYHWDGSLGSKRNLFQLDLTERFAWWLANLYFLLRLSVPHGTLNSSVPWFFFWNAYIGRI